ncbi:MAG: hypothetical protein ACREHF_14100 [Rhizomicrobium sp.]
MKLTDYHAKFFAHELTKRSASDSVEKLASVLADAQVVVAELSGEAAKLGKSLHPRTASNLADLVRIMNTYYGNLIEGHKCLAAISC